GYESVKNLPYVRSISLSKNTNPCFPYSSYTKNWTGADYGPLTIPKEGMKITISDSTLAIYGSTITDYENLKDVKIEKGKLLISGKEVNEYTFAQNYYFMMGDNRDNSHDSRYWGFVPEDHIVGKGFFIWLSIDKYGKFFDKIRWNRFFKLIK
ncbi:MAG: signal peptidase I, partial [Flammeovirgaceae bacterium]